MVGCIITGHGDFAQGLMSALEMIAGPQNATQAVIFHEDEAATFGVRLQISTHTDNQDSLDLSDEGDGI